MFNPLEKERYNSEVRVDNPEKLTCLLSENMVQPNTILSVKEGLQFLSEEFPKALILNLDSNQEQNYQYSKITKGYNFSLNQIDLVFFSNSLDYRNPNQCCNIGNTLAKNQVPWILLSHITTGKKLEGHHPKSCRILLNILKENDYRIKSSLDYSPRYNASEYYLAISPQKIQQLSLQKTRREQIRSFTPTFVPV